MNLKYIESCLIRRRLGHGSNSFSAMLSSQEMEKLQGALQQLVDGTLQEYTINGSNIVENRDAVFVIAKREGIEGENFLKKCRTKLRNEIVGRYEGRGIGFRREKGKTYRYELFLSEANCEVLLRECNKTYDARNKPFVPRLGELRKAISLDKNYDEDVGFSISLIRPHSYARERQERKLHLKFLCILYVVFFLLLTGFLGAVYGAWWVVHNW